MRSSNTPESNNRQVSPSLIRRLIELPRPDGGLSSVWVEIEGHPGLLAAIAEQSAQAPPAPETVLERYGLIPEGELVVECSRGEEEPGERSDSEIILVHLYEVFGRAVFLVVPRGSKNPGADRETGWKTVSYEQSQTPQYQAKLIEAIKRGGNIGVLCGPASDGLHAIDVDSDDYVHSFLERNPDMAGATRTRGEKGCQIFFRPKPGTSYPNSQAFYPLKTRSGQKWGEWRCGESGGAQSIVYGLHPEGMRYQFLIDAAVGEKGFDQIQWPPEVVLPWAKAEPKATPKTEYTGAPPNLDARILTYLDTVVEAIDGEGGSNPTYRVACTLVNGFALDGEQALHYLRYYNERRCRPPWSEKELQHKIADALKATHTRPRGHLRDAEPKAERQSGEPEQPEVAQPWPTFDEKAFYGLFGTIVRLIEPHTEADQAAILFQLLASFGNAIGAIPFYVADGTRHYVNLFGCLVGQSSRSRKGTSLTHALRFLHLADQDWHEHHNKSGISSGEGLIWKVRDPIFELERNKKLGTIEEVMVDPGIDDKRLLVTENEFSRVLRVMSREGNTVSEVLRCAWDHRNLETMTKNSPAKATNPHISIVGHITKEELKRELAECDLFNGFANRFLWLLVKRSKLLPHGGTVESSTIASLAGALGTALEGAREIEQMHFDQAAHDYWSSIYERLTADHPSLYGQVISRSEAHTLRLAMLYALSDASPLITLAHLEAALAFWDYCNTSARILFGDRLSNPHAQKILEALRKYPQGMSRKQIYDDVFQRNIEKPAFDLAFATLQKLGLAECETEQSGGRPTERWFIKSR